MAGERGPLAVNGQSETMRGSRRDGLLEAKYAGKTAAEKRAAITELVKGAEEYRKGKAA